MFILMNIWMIGNETSLSELEDFYSHLNMEDSTDADYTHSKSVYKDLKVGNLGKYHIYMFKKIHYC